MHLPEIDFSSLEFKEIGSWPLILRVAVICGVVLAAVVISYFLVFSSEISDFSSAQDKLDSKKKEFKEQYSQAINLDGFKKQMAEMQAAYQEYVNELPSSSNIPELIDTLTKIGERSGLSFSSIKIGDPKLVAGFYMSLPLSINVSGTYHNFGIFVSEVAKMSRIVTISDFAIKSAEDKGAGLLTMELQAQTYWLASVTELQQAKPADKGKKEAGSPKAAAGSKAKAPGASGDASDQGSSSPQPTKPKAGG